MVGTAHLAFFLKLNVKMNPGARLSAMRDHLWFDLCHQGDPQLVRFCIGLLRGTEILERGF